MDQNSSKIQPKSVLETSWGLLRGLGGLPFDGEASLAASWSLLGASWWPTWLHFGSQNGPKITKNSFQDSFEAASGSTSCEKLIFEGCTERNHYFCSCRAPRKPTRRHPKPFQNPFETMFENNIKKNNTKMASEAVLMRFRSQFLCRRPWRGVWREVCRRGPGSRL